MEQFSRTIQEIANRHGIAPETVIAEMEKAIRTTVDTAKKDKNTDLMALWSTISPAKAYPTPEELIDWVIVRIVGNMGGI